MRRSSVYESLMSCLITGAFLGGASPAAATLVTFDFDYFPDSACSQPVSAVSGTQEDLDQFCPLLAGALPGGVKPPGPFVTTIDGLTLTLDSKRGFVWAGGDLSPGMELHGKPYEASFSLPLRSAQVDLVNYLGRDHRYYLEAYDAAGELLLSDERSSGLTLAVSASASDPIYSLQFGIAGTATHYMGFDYEYENLSFADNLVVEPVPEPTTVLLLGFGLLWLRARRSSRY